MSTNWLVCCHRIVSFFSDSLHCSDVPNYALPLPQCALCSWRRRRIVGDIEIVVKACQSRQRRHESIQTAKFLESVQVHLSNSIFKKSLQTPNMQLRTKHSPSLNSTNSLKICSKMSTNVSIHFLLICIVDKNEIKVDIYQPVDG